MTSSSGPEPRCAGPRWGYGKTRPRAAPFGERVVRGLFSLFVLSIPLETLLYFQRDANDPDSSVSLSRVVGTVLLGAAVVENRVCLRRFPAVFWMISWYLAAYALSQLWVPGELHARFQAEQWTLAQMAALFLVSVNLLEDAEFRARVMRRYSRWVCLLALGMLLGVFSTTVDVEERASLVTQDPNVTAWLFGLGALGLAADSRLLRAPRGPFIVVGSSAGIAILLAAILRTGSRGGLLACGAGLLGLAACGGRGRWPRAMIAAAVLALGGFLVRHEFERGTATAARLERSWDDGDTAGRAEIYDAAWSMFLERPLLGYGGTNNRFELGSRLNYPDRDTHNVFLQVLTEVGVAGGGVFLLGLLVALAQGWRAARLGGDALPFAAMCALLVINASITGSREKIFWVVLACAAASGMSARSSSGEA